MDIYNQILLLLEKEFNLPVGSYYIPEEKKGLLKEISEILEAYWRDWDFESIELTAGIGTKSLYVSLTAADLIAENGRNNHLFRVISLADSVRFSQKERDFLCMELQFKNVAEDKST